jgi:hypothetical protein
MKSQENAVPLKAITESQFYMWRTLFAMSHVDNEVSDDEVRFMAEALEDIPFSPEQKEMLREDTKTPQDIVEMFSRISDMRDQARFFKFAHDLVWADGKYDLKEQEMMLRLQKAHVRTANVDELVGGIEMEFEDDAKKKNEKSKTPKKPKSTKDLIFSFRAEFLKNVS